MAGVEEFELAPAASASVPADAGSSRARRRPTSRVLTWVGIATGLVAAGAMTATPVPLGVGTGIAVGVVDLPLDVEPEVLWQNDVADALLVHTAGDRAVVTIDDTGSRRSVIGVDLGTGEQVWRFDDVDYTCQWGMRVVCVLEPGEVGAQVVTIALDDGGQVRHEHPGALAAIDAGNGRLVVVEAGEGEAEPGTGQVDGEAPADGPSQHVVLLDGDGVEQWRTQAPVGHAEDRPPPAVSMQVDLGYLWLDYTSVTIDLSTGDSVAASRFTLPDGVIIEVGDEVDAAETATIRSAEGSVTIGVEERPLWMNDDVGGPVVLEQQFDDRGTADLVATMRATGETIWVQDSTDCSPEARLRGLLIVLCSTDRSAMGIDTLTGEVRWQVPMDGWPVAASTDTIVLAADLRGDLHAVDASTGENRWTHSIDGASYVTASPISNGLIVTTDIGMLRLSWP